MTYQVGDTVRLRMDSPGLFPTPTEWERAYWAMYGTVTETRIIERADTARPGLAPYQRIRVDYPDGAMAEGAAYQFEQHP